MKTLFIELKKQKRTGVIPVMLLIGILGVVYIFINYLVREQTLLNLPLEPMDILLTQLYGMIMVLNLFGIIVATCISYNIEFKANAIKKMYMLPINISSLYLCKFLILTLLFIVIVTLQYMALAQIGINYLPVGSFHMQTLLQFAMYSFITSMPVLSFMLLLSSYFESIWIPLGIGVTGFLSGMALGSIKHSFLMVIPFVIMLKPALAMNASVDSFVILFAIVETLVFLILGVCLAQYKHYE